MTSHFGHSIHQMRDGTIWCNECLVQVTPPGVQPERPVGDRFSKAFPSKYRGLCFVCFGYFEIGDYILIDRSRYLDNKKSAQHATCVGRYRPKSRGGR